MKETSMYFFALFLEEGRSMVIIVSPGDGEVFAARLRSPISGSWKVVEGSARRFRTDPTTTFGAFAFFAGHRVTQVVSYCARGDIPQI